MIGTTISHYRIVEELGRGGMGVVYKAVDVNLDRDVALKFLPPHLAGDSVAKERFIQEAKTASSLDHPNICTIYDIADVSGFEDSTVTAESSGRTFIAMACYDGQTLREKLDDGPIPHQEAVNIAAQVLKGLGKAHEAGIIHRDIKPANIMLTTDGTVKILDFGVAKLGEGQDLTREGSTIGTTAYMSPEQVRGEEASAQTDLWAAGVLLYEMLSGKKPFSSGYEQATVYSILNEPHKALVDDDAPEELRIIVDRLLEKDPTERYNNAAEVLGLIGAGELTMSRTGVSATSRNKISPPLIALIAVVVALGIWGLSTVITPSDAETPDVPPEGSHRDPSL